MKQKKCKHCGCEIPVGANFCPHCGEEPTFSRRKKAPFIIVSLIVVLAAGIAGTLYWLKDTSLTASPVFEETQIEAGSGTLYVPASDSYATDEETGISYVNDIVLIFFELDATQEQIDQAIASTGGTVVGSLPVINQYQVQVEASTLQELQNRCERLNEMDGVVQASYDPVVPIGETRTSNDPWPDVEIENGKNNSFWSWVTGIFQKQEEEQPKDKTWWLDAIHAQGAWEYNDQLSSVRIGVLDMGFDTNHEDLKNKINFVNDFNIPDSHGTRCAGIIGAEANNGLGMAGLVWNGDLDLWDIALTEEQSAQLQADAPNYVAMNMILGGAVSLIEDGCQVINLSNGQSNYYTMYIDNETGAEKYRLKTDQAYLDMTKEEWMQYYSSCNYSETISLYFLPLLENGYDFVLVQSAGNGDSNHVSIDASMNGWFTWLTLNKDDIVYSDHYSSIDLYDRIIVVGSARPDGTGGYIQASTSNAGSRVDICAPGDDVYSTDINSSYTFDSGTSFAAPIVSGVAGLVWAANPDLTGEEVKSIICYDDTHTDIVADNTEASHPLVNSYPLVNAEECVKVALELKGNIENVEQTATNHTDWVIAPQYAFDDIELIYSDEIDNFVDSPIYVVQQDGRWSIWDGQSDGLVLENVFESKPYLDSWGLLAASESENQNLERNAEAYNRTLEETGLQLQVTYGHGDTATGWLEDTSTNQIYYYIQDVGPASYMTVQEHQPTTLTGVLQAEWILDGPDNLLTPLEGSLYGIMDLNGTIVTEFTYRNTAVPSSNLIAVQPNGGTDGLWGYCDSKGSLAIPCEFKAQEIENIGIQCPYPEIGGLVVVRNSNDQYGVLDINGREIISFGMYGRLSPSNEAGYVWAQENGLWGLLHLTSDSSEGSQSTAQIPDYSSADFEFLENCIRYQGHFYKIVDGNLTWDGAKLACENYGGHLATITSQEEQELIQSLNTDNKRLWIGGYQDADGNWRWVTDEPWDYTNWGDGEPNNSSNVVAGESCVALWPESWNDLANENVYEQEGYVFEWDEPVVSQDERGDVGAFVGDYDNPNATDMNTTYSISIQPDGTWNWSGNRTKMSGISYEKDGQLYLIATASQSYSNADLSGWSNTTTQISGVATIHGDGLTITWKRPSQEKNADPYTWTESMVKKGSNLELSSYMGTSLAGFLETFPAQDLQKLNTTGTSTEYQNEYLTVGAGGAAAGYGEDVLTYLSIDAPCAYLIYGLSYGIPIDNAISQLQTISSCQETDDRPNYKRFSIGDSTGLTIFTDGTIVTGITLMLN